MWTNKIKMKNNFKSSAIPFTGSPKKWPDKSSHFLSILKLINVYKRELFC